MNDDGNITQNASVVDEDSGESPHLQIIDANNSRNSFVVPDSSTHPKTWLDGVFNSIPKPVLNRQLSNTQTQNSSDQENNNDEKVVRSTSRSNLQVSALQEKIQQQEDEIDKLRQNASLYQRLNTELKCTTTNATDRTFQEKIEELVKEVTFEQTEKFHLLRKITDLNLRVDELDEKLENERSLVDNNEDVDKRFASVSRDLTETQQELHMSQRAVIRLQKEQDAIGSIYDKKFHEAQAVVNKERDQLQNERAKLRIENEKMQQQFRKIDDHEKKIKEWQSQLFQKDETIKQLKSKLSSLSLSLDSAQKDKDVSRSKLESVEQYLHDEVTDLRLLNDGQEQEIQRLRIELEMAVSGQATASEKVRGLEEIQEQEITRLRAELDKRDGIDQRVEEMHTSNEKLRGLQKVNEQEISRLRKENENLKIERKSIDQKVEELEISINQFNSQISQGDDNQESQRRSELIAIECSLTIGKLVACRDRIGAALQDIEARDILKTSVQRVEEVEQLLEHNNATIDSLETELAESRRVIDSLYVKMKQMKDSYESKIASLNTQTDAVSTDRVALKKKISELNGKISNLQDERNELRESNSGERSRTVSTDQTRHIQQMLDEAEKKNQMLERNLLEAKLKLAAAEEQKAQIQEEFEHRFSSKHEEKKLDDFSDQAGERTSDRAISTNAARDCAILMDEIELLNSQILQMRQQQDVATMRSVPIQSKSSLEEDLRKELESARNKEKLLLSQLHNALEDNANVEERDKTISRLMKSTVTLERRLECARIEIDILRARLAKEIGADQVKLATGDSMSLDDLKKLRDTTLKSKNIEDSVHAKVERLQRELKKTQELNASIQIETNDRAINSGAEQQLKERDTAISKLVKQSMAQDKIISELKKGRKTAELTIQTLTSNLEKAPTLDEINQLRQEAEVFAGQVIELDDEIQALKNTMSEQTLRISDLENELAAAKEERVPAKVAHPSIIKRYEAEIDELKEANAEQLEELRRFRKKARDVEASAEAIAKAKKETAEVRNEALAYQRRVDELSREKAGLLKDAELSARKISDMEMRLKKDINVVAQQNEEKTKGLQDELSNALFTIQQLKTSQCNVDEIELDCMKGDLTTLRRTVEQLTQELNIARSTVQELESMLAEKSASQASAAEEEKDELIAEIESLTQQLQEVTKQRKDFEEERSLIDDFKSKLELADDAREELERTLTESYERKITLITQDKDTTIDNLHNKLFDEKNMHADEKEELLGKIKEYEEKVTELNDKLESQVNEKDTRIYALERTLEAQEQLVANMKTEMDQLQGGMETSAVRRRNEIDELQQEIIALTSTNSKLDREIKSLKIEIEANQMSHKDEVTKLRDTIGRYEQQNAHEHRTASDLQMELRIKEVKDRLEKLKWRNTSLKEENENLRERLAVAQADATENKRQLAQITELREMVSTQSIMIDELQTGLSGSHGTEKETEHVVTPTTTESGPVTRVRGIDCDTTPQLQLPIVRPPLPPGAASPVASSSSAPNTPRTITNKKTEKTRDVSPASSASSRKVERKNSAPSPKRGLNFRLVRKSSFDTK